MQRHDDPEMDRDLDSTVDDGETHATTGGAAAAGAVTGGVVGLAGGPLGAAIGAVGGAIMGVAAERMMHSDDDAERARRGLDNDHDRNPLVEDRARADRTEMPAAGHPNSYGNADDTGETLRLREEELQAHTTPVQTGQVTLGKEVVTEERTLDVPVKREEVVVERHPVERRPVDQAIGDTLGRTIDVPVHQDEVTVDKQPVVYEEVGVGTRNVTETEHVSDTVRREEARIDREGETHLRND